jgi:hypothetical protein
MPRYYNTVRRREYTGRQPYMRPRPNRLYLPLLKGYLERSKDIVDILRAIRATFSSPYPADGKYRNWSKEQLWKRLERYGDEL